MTQCIALGSPYSVFQEEGWIPASVYRIYRAEQGHYKE